MTCPHCTAFNDSDATVCRQCGKPLYEGDLLSAVEPKRARNVSDTGYLLIALVALGMNVFSWWQARLLAGKPVEERIAASRSMQVVFYAYPVLLFAILFLFSKRIAYRAIIIVSALAILYLNVRRILHY